MLQAAKPLLRDPQYQDFLKDIDRYWRAHFGHEVTRVWHLAFARGTGLQDVRFIPAQIYADAILPHLNDLPLRPAYRDKNLSDVLVKTDRRPSTPLRRIQGSYFSGTTVLQRQDILSHLAALEGRPLIIKGSRTDNGVGIRSLSIVAGKPVIDGQTCGLSDLEQLYGTDYLIQERIIQHDQIAAIHPQSLNTLRIVTLRWQGRIHKLVSFLRVGCNGQVTDNLSRGGLGCGIDADGRFREIAFDFCGNGYRAHPNTGYVFATAPPVPGHAAACQFACDLHRQVFHFDLISWDIAISASGEPVFLEMNFRGPSDSYQLTSGQPLFGALTAEVLEAVRDGRHSGS
nr:sugar-transfer associated ATP-grasp domain-containing protein [Pseudohoeflea sp. DP4N28-3]